MANFCRFCGSPLEEGQVCACQANQAAPEAAPAAPAAPVATAAPAAAPAAPGLGNKLIETLKNYWKAPKATAAAVAEDPKGMTIAGIFAGVNVLAVFFFLWRILGMMVSAIVDPIVEAAKQFSDERISASEVLEEMGLEYPIFPMLIAGVAIAVLGILVGALAVFVVAKIKKQEVNFKQLILVQAVHSIVPTALLVVGIILGLLLPALQFLVLALILVLWFINVCADIRDVAGVEIMESGKSMAINTLVVFAILAVTVYLMSLIGGWGIGELEIQGATLNEAFEQISEAMEEGGGFLGMFMGGMF